MAWRRGRLSAGSRRHLPAMRLPSPKGRGHLRIRLSDLEVLMARGCQVVSAVLSPLVLIFIRL